MKKRNLGNKVSKQLEVWSKLTGTVMETEAKSISQLEAVSRCRESGGRCWGGQGQRKGQFIGVGYEE